MDISSISSSFLRIFFVDFVFNLYFSVDLFFNRPLTNSGTRRFKLPYFYAFQYILVVAISCMHTTQTIYFLRMGRILHFSPFFSVGMPPYVGVAMPITVKIKCPPSTFEAYSRG